MEEPVNKIDSTEELKDPRFIKPILLNYSQGGVKKKWEAVVSHDSVAVLLWHSGKKEFILEIGRAHV